jgi:hypothetical protein
MGGQVLYRSQKWTYSYYKLSHHSADNGSKANQWNSFILNVHRTQTSDQGVIGAIPVT